MWGLLINTLYPLLLKNFNKDKKVNNFAGLGLKSKNLRKKEIGDR